MPRAQKGRGFQSLVSSRSYGFEFCREHLAKRRSSSTLCSRTRIRENGTFLFKAATQKLDLQDLHLTWPEWDSPSKRRVSLLLRTEETRLKEEHMRKNWRLCSLNILRPKTCQPSLLCWKRNLGMSSRPFDAQNWC